MTASGVLSRNEDPHRRSRGRADARRQDPVRRQGRQGEGHRRGGHRSDDPGPHHLPADLHRYGRKPQRPRPPAHRHTIRPARWFVTPDEQPGWSAISAEPPDLPTARRLIKHSHPDLPEPTNLEVSGTLPPSAQARPAPCSPWTLTVNSGLDDRVLVIELLGTHPSVTDPLAALESVATQALGGTRSQVDAIRASAEGMLAAVQPMRRVASRLVASTPRRTLRSGRRGTSAEPS